MVYGPAKDRRLEYYRTPLSYVTTMLGVIIL